MSSCYKRSKLRKLEDVVAAAENLRGNSPLSVRWALGPAMVIDLGQTVSLVDLVGTT
jgi:hypothetical protein